MNEAPTQQAVGYLPIGLIDVASGDSSQSLQAAGYLNENQSDRFGFSCQLIGSSEWLMRKKTIGADRMFNI